MSNLMADWSIREGDVMLAKPKHFEPRPEGAGSIGHHPVVVLTYPDNFGKVKVASMSHSHPNNPPQKPTSLFNLPRDPVKGEGAISVGEPKIIDYRMLKLPSAPTAMRPVDLAALKAEIPSRSSQLSNIVDENSLKAMTSESLNGEEGVFWLSARIKPDDQNHLTSSFGVLETDKISGQLVAKYKPEKNPPEPYQKNLSCFPADPERRRRVLVYPSAENGFGHYSRSHQAIPQQGLHIPGSLATHDHGAHGILHCCISQTGLSDCTICASGPGANVKGVNTTMPGPSKSQVYSHTLLQPIYIPTCQPPVTFWPVFPEMLIKGEESQAS